jgi:hypothetical protein
MPVWFETGIPQSWAWTLLSPYIKSCPPVRAHIPPVSSRYPDLTISVTEQPSYRARPLSLSSQPSQNNLFTFAQVAKLPRPQHRQPTLRSRRRPCRLDQPKPHRARSRNQAHLGRSGQGHGVRQPVQDCDLRGKAQGESSAERTVERGTDELMPADVATQFLAFVSQLNVTYAPLYNIRGRSACAYQSLLSRLRED